MDHNRQVHILPRSQSQETDPSKVGKFVFHIFKYKLFYIFQVTEVKNSKEGFISSKNLEL